MGKDCPLKWTLLSTPRDYLFFRLETHDEYPMKSTKNDGDDMTLAGRIKIGMAAKGIKTPTELARRLKLNRQTVHKWVNGDVDTLENDLLFRLADVLDMSPRWLATREGGPQAYRTLSTEDQRVLDLYRALKPAVRNAWVQSGDALLSSAAEPSVAQPFSKHR